MKIGICLFIKDENQYLKEWIDYHKSIGINHFFIYDNQSSYSVTFTLADLGLEHVNNISVELWNDNGIGGQMRAYEDCCKKHKDCEYIAFIDTDEFIMLNGYSTIQECLGDFEKKYGKFFALGMSWRFYGSNPVYKTRQPMENYVQYHENEHIKSIVDPKKVLNFKDPHKATLNWIAMTHKNYINELGEEIKNPREKHTSKNIWIKHIWTRSEEEFKDKIVRGRGDKVPSSYTMQDFEDYNKKCILHD